MSLEKRKILNHNIISSDSDIKKNLDDILYNSKIGDIIDYFDNNGSYVRFEVKKLKIKEPNNFNIYEGQNFDEKILEILKEANFGDIIWYITNNQLGVKKYIIINDSGHKSTKEIGDIYGNYDSADHPNNHNHFNESNPEHNRSLDHNINNHLLDPNNNNYPNYII